MPSPPAPLIARYAPKALLQRLSLIFVLVVLALAAPLLGATPVWALARFYGIVALILLALALVVAKRFKDTTPQVAIDESGLYVRAWHLGIVPWGNISLVVHSHALKGRSRALRLRRRLGDHLIVRFRTFPVFQPSLPPPLGWLQRFWHALGNSDPAIGGSGLDTNVHDLMAAIHAHMDWHARTTAA